VKILRPQSKRLLLKRTLLRQIGSIIVPEKSEEMKFSFAEVMDSGPDCINGYKPGDVVYFGRYAAQIVNAKELAIYGIKINPAKVELLILNEEDVLCDMVDEPDEKLLPHWTELEEVA
jgi:hypothetical protein